MDAGDLATVAEDLIAFYRDLLLVDPFYRIKVEISEGDFVSQCVIDAAPLTWILKLNPSRHNDAEDVRYSVVESLLVVLFYLVDIADKDKVAEAKQGLISRLATAITVMADVLTEEDSDDSEELETQ